MNRSVLAFWFAATAALAGSFRRPRSAPRLRLAPRARHPPRAQRPPRARRPPRVHRHLRRRRFRGARRNGHGGAGTGRRPDAGAGGSRQPHRRSRSTARPTPFALRDLEQRIDELKEQIRRSHTRLSLLSDTILSGGVGGARAEIVFKNELSNAFRLTGATFVLDGAVQYNKQDDTGALAEQKEIPIFSGSVPPGRSHAAGRAQAPRPRLRRVLVPPRLQVRRAASHSFTVTEGKTIQLEAIAWEKGDVTTPLEERPAIRWRPEDRRSSAGRGRDAGAGGTRDVGRRVRRSLDRRGRRSDAARRRPGACARRRCFRRSRRSALALDADEARGRAEHGDPGRGSRGGEGAADPARLRVPQPTPASASPPATCCSATRTTTRAIDQL